VAARCVTNGVSFCLARYRRKPERLSEPRLSGVHPEEAEWNDGVQFRLSGFIEGEDEQCGLLTADQSVRQGTPAEILIIINRLD
jgi:hypothetical protein